MGIFIYKNGKTLNLNSGGQYDGEKMPGDLDAWNVLSSDANKMIYNSYDLLSTRSSTLYHTYSPIKSAINKQTQYAIGSGLAFRSQPNWQIIPGMTAESAKDWGKQFQQLVNFYYESYNFYEKQPVLFRGGLTVGDSLLMFERKNGVLTDLIEFGGDQINCKYNEGNYTLGIKHDDLLRAKGIMKIDGKKISFQTPSGNQNLIQYYDKQLPRQLRGYPLAYTMINLAKNDDRHHDAAVQRAVMETIMMGSFETDTTNPMNQVKNMAEANSKKKGGVVSSLLSKIGNAKQIGAGNMMTLRKGEKVTFTDLKTPNANFGVFKDWIINYIAMGTDTPPEVIMSKYSTSYTAHRGALNDFQKAYTQKRKTFERNVIKPVIREILKDAVLQGFISAPGIFENPMLLNAYIQGNNLAPIPGVINPVQEANANEKNVLNGFEQRGDVAARFGNEWSNHIEEWGEQEQEWFSKSPSQRSEIIQNTEVNNA
jgi:hypothetical protein